MLKERAKLQREPQERVKFTLSKRLSRDIVQGEEVKQDRGGAEKRVNLGGGQAGKPHDRKNEASSFNVIK